MAESHSITRISFRPCAGVRTHTREGITKMIQIMTKLTIKLRSARRKVKAINNDLDLVLSFLYNYTNDIKCFGRSGGSCTFCLNGLDRRSVMCLLSTFFDRLAYFEEYRTIRVQEIDVL